MSAAPGQLILVTGRWGPSAQGCSPEENPAQEYTPKDADFNESQPINWQRIDATDIRSLFANDEFPAKTEHRWVNSDCAWNPRNVTSAGESEIKQGSWS
jgi:hypothetical protein